ncbi:serine hydrolase, partial [Mycobacterium tuberculosis]|nr:serine hydrolase [Mycobacterium tuberculosis]
MVVGEATLAELLQHRAGLDDYGGLAAYHAAVAAGDDAWPVERLLQAVGPAADRGGWRYSNVGYLHVRRFLEDRAGAAFGAVLA